MKKLYPAVALAAMALGACSSSSDMGAVELGGNGISTPATETPQAQAATPEASTPEVTQEVTGEPETGAAEEAPAEPVQTAAEESMLVASASSVACDASTDEFRDTMLAMVNNSRKTARMCGASSEMAVGAVSWNDLLTNAAVLHARDMVEFNFFSHTGSDGLGVSHRADGVGYTWSAIGENIAAGQPDIAEVHQGWLDSPGHCRNIMHPGFTEIGAACITTNSAEYPSYWVVVFGDKF